jgi:archaea-specific DNA-binding protein
MVEKKPSGSRRRERKPKAEPVAQATPEEPVQTTVNESVVFIGKKPVMNYVLACLTRFNSGSNKVLLKARGRSIPRAVDTLEVLRRSFAKGLSVDAISLYTEEVAREEGRKSNVSAIEIAVRKP